MADDETSPIAPMEAKLVADLPTDDGWQFEPKWDGFRCLGFKSGGVVKLFAKSGKPLHRYFPEVAETLLALEADDFVVDGELVIPIGAHHSFDALQARLHPAESRIRKLSKDTPAVLILFDMLTAPGGRVLAAEPLSVRRKALRAFANDVPKHKISLSPTTTDREKAAEWLAGSGGDVDGIVAKRLDGPYASGERAMLKIKRMRSADCVVGGFRYGTGSELVGSLLLGLYNAEGKLDHVGFTSQISNAERPALTEKLKAHLGGPGFTGNAPGGPSRWSTERTSTYEPLQHELVVEIGYDQITGGRFRHGSRLLRWRPDKAPSQCTYEQLKG